MSEKLENQTWILGHIRGTPGIWASESTAVASSNLVQLCQCHCDECDVMFLSVSLA